MIIDPQFDEVENFIDGICKVIVDEKEGYINKAGQYIF